VARGTDAPLPAANLPVDTGCIGNVDSKFPSHRAANGTAMGGQATPTLCLADIHMGAMSPEWQGTAAPEVARAVMSATHSGSTLLDAPSSSQSPLQATGEITAPANRQPDKQSEANVDVPSHPFTVLFTRSQVAHFSNWFASTVLASAGTLCYQSTSGIGVLVWPQPLGFVQYDAGSAGQVMQRTGVVGMGCVPEQQAAGAVIASAGADLLAVLLKADAQRPQTGSHRVHR
jgi:hypothetical protein